MNPWLTLPPFNKNSATFSKIAAFSTDNHLKNNLITDFASIPNPRISPSMKSKNNCRQICAIYPSIKSSSTLKVILTSIDLLLPEKWKPSKIFLSTNPKSSIKIQFRPESSNRHLRRSKAKILISVEFKCYRLAKKVLRKGLIQNVWIQREQIRNWPQKDQIIFIQTRFFYISQKNAWRNSISWKSHNLL